MRKIIMWSVLFTLFAIVTIAVLNMPSWIKENAQLNIIIQLTLYMALALGFFQVLRKSL